MRSLTRISRLQFGAAILVLATVAGLRIDHVKGQESAGSDGSEPLDQSLFSACDLDGDGAQDLIIGAPKEHDALGRVYFFYGPLKEGEDLFAEQAAFTLESPDGDTEAFGQVVQCIPDVNDDGDTDILVQAAFYEKDVKSARVYVFSGATAQLISIEVAEGNGSGGNNMMGSGGLPPCYGDITGPLGDPNGVVDTDDLLAVIISWGSCPSAPNPCPADIAPEGDTDGVVDVDDLLAVVNNWGNCDYDGDGVPDSWEIEYGMDAYANDANGDLDSDGVLNNQEFLLDSNPLLTDSDGDGVSDGQEVNQGTDPANSSDGGVPDPNDVIYIYLAVGDIPQFTGCQGQIDVTELWGIHFGSRFMFASPGDYEADPEETNTYFYDCTYGGECDEPYRITWEANGIPVKVGRSYPITIEHLGSSGTPVNRYWSYLGQHFQSEYGGSDIIAILADTYSIVDGPYCNYNPSGKTAKLIVPKIDIDARRMVFSQDGGALAEDREESPGAFVPVNNDDDDYDASNDPDKDQSGPISGENDLLPVVIRAIEPADAGGHYYLSIPPSVSVWPNADRSGDEIKWYTQLPTDHDITVYVEGVVDNTWNPDGSTLSVNWDSGFGELLDEDRINLHVFTMTGPLNVPGYTIYNYKSTLAAGEWVNSNTSEVKTGAGTADATILWGEGPVVSDASFWCNVDYVWNLNVNVVQLSIASTGNIATYPGIPTQVGGANNALISSSTTGDAMTAQITVDAIVGPAVGLSGVQRGRKFVELGLVHQAEFAAKHGLFNHSSPSIRRRSSLQDGQVHWDAGDQSTIPWVYTTADHYLHVSSDAQVVSGHVFETSDNPIILCTDQFSIANDQVDVLALSMHHYLYLAVRSTGPDINGSASVVTQRASLVWYTDCTGTVGANGVWSLDIGTGVNGEPDFSNVTNGLSIPTAAGNLNEAFSSESWTTENQ